jgi:Thioredoxin like C-terminal domain
LQFLRSGRIPAPEIDGVDWAGDVLHLGTLRGRVVLLDFFSYGDPGSVLTLERVRALGEHYREAGLAVAGLHVPAYAFERRAEDARREIWRLGIPHPVALDADFRMFHRYGLEDLPARVLVDAGGMLRGWTQGSDEFEALEGAVRTLLREVNADLPPRHETEDSLPRPGALRWRPTPEIRFGERGVGFGPPEDEGRGGPGDAGASPRTFDMPELRAEGRAYLDGAWSLGAEGIASAGEEAGLAVVYEGSTVHAVVSPAPGTVGSVLDVTLDGHAVDPELAGADMDVAEARSRSEVAVPRGRVYELISSPEFGVHNLDLRIRGSGTTVHLLSFGTRDVPEAS